MKKDNKYLFILVLTILIINSVSSLGIIQISESPNRIEIDYPKSNIQIENTPFDLNIRTFNFSNGKFINEHINCSLSLKDNNGFIFYQDNLIYNDTSRYFNLLINESYFNETGIFTFDILCENGEIDGFTSGNYEVIYRDTQTSFNANNTLNLIFLIIAVVIAIIFILIGQFIISGIILLIIGLLLINSGINFIIAGIVFLIGFLLIIKNG